MTVERWTFGVEPLPADGRARAAAAPRRRTGAVAGADDARGRRAGRRPARARGAARGAGAGRPAPARRRRRDARAARLRRPLARRRRVQPVLPRVRRSRSTATARTARSTFPVGYEGPPGIVHGGFLAVFFDCVHPAAQLRRRASRARPTSLSLRYRRPTPLLTPLDVRRSSAPIDDGRITSHRRAAPRRRACCATRDDERGRRRPRRAARRLAPAAPMSATVVDAGDGLPLTVPALLARAAASAATIRWWSATTTCSPTPTPSARSARARAGLLAAGAGRGTPRRAALPERRRLRGRLAGGGAHRRDRRADQHVLDRAELRGLLRSADVERAARGARRTAATTTPPRCARPSRARPRATPPLLRRSRRACARVVSRRRFAARRTTARSPTRCASTTRARRGRGRRDARPTAW